MLVLLVLANLAAKTSPAAAVAVPRATIRIHRSASAGAASWKDAPLIQKREIRRKTTNGRIELLRVIDYP